MSSPTPTSLTLTPIGILHCAQQTRVEAPRQPAAADELSGVIELLPSRNFEHALEDLAGWERVWVIFWFHHNAGWRPKVLPPRSQSGRKGVFSTRSPHRPNPLGLSALRLEEVDGLRLHVRGVDLLDGTPVLDIKPYVRLHRRVARGAQRLARRSAFPWRRRARSARAPRHRLHRPRAAPARMDRAAQPAAAA